MQTSAPQFRGVLSSVCEILPRLLIDHPDQCSLLDVFGDSAEHHGKYVRMKIARYCCMDDNESSVRDNKKKWLDRTRGSLPGEFYCIDLSKNLSETSQVSSTLGDKEREFLSREPEKQLFDHAVCYSVKLESVFRSSETAEQFFENCAKLIKVGGYFFGFCLDSSSAWSLFQKEVAKMGNSRKMDTVPLKKNNFLLSLSHLDSTPSSLSSSPASSQHAQLAAAQQQQQSIQDSSFSLFGTQYELKIDTEPVKRNGYMIHFPSFIQIAEKHGFKVVSLDNMQLFYEDYKDIYFDTFNGYLVYKKYKTITQNDMALINLFNIFILQRVDQTTTAQ